MKTGILTLYYHNRNYGALLQSYALCRVINDLGYEAEQICYDFMSEFSVPERHGLSQRLERFMRASFKEKLCKLGRFIRSVGKLLNLRKCNRTSSLLEKRSEAFKRFEKQVPHSGRVYSRTDLGECNEIYRCIIAGSDQIWNPEWFDSAFLLDFAGDDCKKISYAASIAAAKLSDEHKCIFSECLSRFSAVSVREHDAVSLLASQCGVNAELVLDPTLLLTRCEWDDICSSRIVEGRYAFCYFLGEDLKMRKTAKRYARKHGLRLVFLPHILGQIRRCDNRFADEELYDITPSDFISLIKYAEIVFTDSFHAVVFSAIYGTEFTAFPRMENDSGGSRLRTITGLLGCPERVCYVTRNKADAVGYIESLPPLEDDILSHLDDMKAFSLEFLKNSLNGQPSGNTG